MVRQLQNLPNGNVVEPTGLRNVPNGRLLPINNVKSLPTGRFVAGFNFASLASATLVSWFTPRLGVTFNGCFSFGGVNPTISTPGTNFFATGAGCPRAEIVIGGAFPGPVTARFSLDDGYTYLTPDVGIALPATFTFPNGFQMGFAAGTYVQDTIIKPSVDQLNDQIGGFHLTRNAAQNGPILSQAGRSNNGFNRACIGTLGYVGMCANAQNVLEQLGALANTLFTGTGKTFDIWFFGGFNVLGNGIQSLWAGSNNPGNGLVQLTDGGNGTAPPNKLFTAFRNNANVVTQTPTPSVQNDLKSGCYRVWYDGTTLRESLNGVLISSVALAPTAITANRFAVFATLISGSAIQRAIATCSEILCFNGNLNATDAATCLFELQYMYGWRAPKTINQIFAGDSFQAPAKGQYAYPNVMQFGNDNFTGGNLAFIGADMNDMEALLPTILGMYNAGANANYVDMHIGSNDLGSSGSGDVAALISRLSALVTTCRNAGFQFVGHTLIPRGAGPGLPPTPAFLAKMAIFNQAMRGGTIPVTAINDEEDQWPGVPNDGVWYQDETHPSQQAATSWQGRKASTILNNISFLAA